MNKMIRTTYVLMLFWFVEVSLTNAYAMLRGHVPDDPLIHMNYRDAFDQKTIHRKYQGLMKTLKCEANVSQEKDHSQHANTHAINLSKKTPQIEPKYAQYISESSPLVGTSRSNYSTINDTNLLLFDEDIEEQKEQPETAFETNLASFDEKLPEWKLYKKDCLKKLRSARRWAILEQARDCTATLMLLGGATGTVVWLLGTDSYGGSIAIFGGLFNSVVLVREIIGGCSNLFHTPSHPLDELEKQFAVNQCFIPKDLWPPLVAHFMTARQNSFSQQKSMDFIKFTLGLTTYYPRPPIVLNKSIDETLDELSSTIDNFFEDYNDIENQEEYHKLKINLLKFVLSLLKKDKLSRYIYLHGPGGIGKTYFAQELCKWLNMATNNSVHIENYVITSSDELEGNENKPGVFLRALQNHCVTKKLGSIVFMDEASWLNKENMVSPSKRVFNGELAQITSSYLGSGIDGTGIHLEIPPMLIIVAANDIIKDEPLRSRFDTFNFPLPNKKALIKHAQRLIKENTSTLPQKKRISINSMAKRIQECESFREIEALVPSLVSQLLYPNSRKSKKEIIE